MDLTTDRIAHIRPDRLIRSIAGVPKRETLSAIFVLIAMLLPHSVYSKQPLQGETRSPFIEVAPGNFVSFGQHLDISRDSVDRIANTGFIIGTQSVALVDPGGSYEAVEHLLDAVGNETELPISHVIITHMHPDHSLGLLRFLASAPVDENQHQHTSGNTHPLIVGHSKLWRAMLENTEFFRENFSTENTDLFYDLDIEKLVEIDPVTAIEEKMTIDLGERVLQIQAYPVAHTNNDISIYDAASGTLWAGDLVFAERLPALDGNLKQWVSVIDQLEALDPSLVIPGHGAAADWPQAGKPIQQYLQRLLSWTRKAVAEQVSLAAFIETEWPWAGGHWQLYSTQHQLNLARAYTELEWE